jgi:uncharacterized protein (DUF342 family)
MSSLDAPDAPNAPDRLPESTEPDEALSKSPLDDDKASVDESGTDPTPADTASVEALVLSYNSLRMRAQLTLTHEDCQRTETPPPDVFERVRARLREDLKAGHINYYTLYKKQLERVWAAMRATETPGRPVVVTIAAALPKMSGVKVEAGQTPDTAAYLTIKAPPAVVADWRLEWLELHVARALRKAGTKMRPHPVQLHGALLRAQAGETIERLPLAPRPELRDEQDGRPEAAFQLTFNRLRKEVGIVIFDLTAIQNISAAEARLSRIEKTLAELKASSRRGYRLLKRDMLEAFERARHGPERFGIGMPLALLVAIDPTPLAAAAATTAPNAATARAAGAAPAAKSKTASTPAGGKSLLPIAIAPDGMTATLALFDKAIYARVGAPLDETWLRAQLAAAGITHGAGPELLVPILDTFATESDPSGMIVAKGTPPEPGSDPYVHLGHIADPNVVDMRSYRKTTLMRKGELAAQIIFRRPARDGVNVRGEPVPPSALTASPLDVPVGEGINAGEPGKFYALDDGVVEMNEHGALVLKKMLIHEGDVNMTSGDIVFNGPVEITGSIDSGVRVEAKGDLSVRGEIRGGKIRCGGNLEVARGIVLGQGGTLRVRGDLSADFIENSTIDCTGTVRVKKSILQCRIAAGEAILVESPSGVIGGGTYTAGKVMEVANLGLPDGAKTHVSVGTSYKSEAMASRRAARLESLKARQEEDRKMHRELARTRPAQLTKNDKSQKQELSERLTRWSGILETATKHAEAAHAALSVDPQSRIRVSGKLAATCVVKLAGKAIMIDQEKVSVEITTEEKDGSHIHPKTA